MPDNISFVWPATGPMQVTSLPGGGCNLKVTFADRGIVRSVAAGRILKVRNIPTRRIARQYEIIIRHDGGFESSYSIVDQTPHLPAGELPVLRALGSLVEHGGELYDIRNGGFLHFQLFHAGKLVDLRNYIRSEFADTIDASCRSPEP